MFLAFCFIKENIHRYNRNINGTVVKWLNVQRNIYFYNVRIIGTIKSLVKYIRMYMSNLSDRSQFSKKKPKCLGFFFSFTEKYNQALAKAESEKQSLVKEVAAIRGQYAELNSQLDTMRRLIEEKQVYEYIMYVYDIMKYSIYSKMK